MKWKDYKLFFSFLYPYWHKEILMFVFMIAGTLAGLASPYALKIIIDKSIPGKDYGSILTVLGALVVIYIFRLGIGYCSDYVSTWIANRVVHDIKIRLFSNLLHKEYSYFEENNAGNIIQKVNQEIHKVQYFLTNSLLRLTNNVLTIVGLSVMLCLLDYRLFLVSLSIFPFSIILNRVWNKKIKALVEKTSVEEGRIFNFYIDRIRNIKLIRHFNAAGLEVNALVSRLNVLFGLYQQSSSYSSLSRNTSTFFVVSGPLIVLAYGGFRAISGMLTVGALVAFIQYMNRLYAPSNDMIFFYVDYIRARVSMSRMLPLLTVPPAVSCHRATKPCPHIETLSLNRICFSYSSREVICNLSLVLEQGKKYGIAGLSGSGKSTLLKILCRLYDPLAGSITVNKTLPLQEISHSSWNEQVTIIHQEPLLFTESIRFNLTYGGREVNEPEIWAALEAVQLAAFVMQQPKQLDTLLGEGGTAGILLSGGQQQQIAIARSLLKGGQVLILDEATSAIDSYKEQVILENVMAKYKDRIIISISHRLSTIRDMDEIVVLNNGQVRERGTHAALVAAKGHYYMLFKNQLHNTGSVII